MIMDGRRGTGQIGDFVDLHIERKSYFVSYQFETIMVEHAINIAARAGELIIDANDAGASFK
jgi:hypothetical protein